MAWSCQLPPPPHAARTRAGGNASTRRTRERGESGGLNVYITLHLTNLNDPCGFWFQNKKAGACPGVRQVKQNSPGCVPLSCVGVSFERARLGQRSQWASLGCRRLTTICRGGASKCHRSKLEGGKARPLPGCARGAARPEKRALCKQKPKHMDNARLEAHRMEAAARRPGPQARVQAFMGAQPKYYLPPCIWVRLCGPLSQLAGPVQASL